MKAGPLFAALHFSDVDRMKIGLLRELFLTPARLRPATSDCFTQDLSSAPDGKGPGTDARLIELAIMDSKEAAVIFSLRVSADGTVVSLVSQSDAGPVALLGAGIGWQSGEWHLVTLNYGPKGTELFLDGQLAAEGAGTLAVPPNVAALAVGSTLAGTDGIEGELDEIYSFGRPLSEDDVAFYYQGTSGHTALGPITAAEDQARRDAAAKRKAEREAAGESGGPEMRVVVGGTSECITNAPLYITNIVSVFDTNQGWTVTFDVQGTNAPADIFTTTNLSGNNITNSQWTWLERGPSCSTYQYTNQSGDQSYFILGTLRDADSDGLTDAYEILVSKTDPNVFSTPDTDGDALPDAWEIAHGLNPLVNDAGEDPDDDDRTNLLEYQNNSDPFDNMLVVWGDNASRQSEPPWGLGPVTSMAGGGGRASGGHTLAVTNGVVVAWGANDYHQTEVPPNLTNVLAVVAGGDQSAALKTDGTVVQWGRTNSAIPSGLTNVVALSAGYQHFLALRADGTVASWGLSNSPANTVPAGLNGVRAIAAGWNHNLALRTDGSVTVWGYGGQIFGWNLTNAPAGLTNIAAIAAGALHSLALRSNGTVVAWGYNANGETNVPAGLSNVIAIAAGRGYSLALRADGSVSGWGPGLPYAPPGLVGLTSIAAGPAHALATRRGVLTPLIVSQPRSQGEKAGGTAKFQVVVSSRREPSYQWQFNETNTIAGATNATLFVTNVQASSQGSYRVRVSNGAGTIYSASAEFVLVLPPVLHSPVTPQTVWAAVGSNSTLSVVVTAQGSELRPLNYTWYLDGAPVPLSVGTADLVLGGPVAVEAGQYWVAVTNVAGSTNSATWTVRLLKPGTVAAWGNTPVFPPGGLTNAIALAGGGAHSLGLDENGVVSGWGTNDSGQTNVPAGLSNVIAIAAGAAHSLALKADGTVISWGRNDFNQTNVPANVTSAKAISAGGNQSLALKQDGTVVQWGQTNVAVPAVLTNATAIASGTNFHVALRSNTTVIAWGSNDAGQTNVPANLSNVVAIAAGGRHALALRENGTVVSWGNNSSGQTNVPASLANAMTVAAGNTFSAALRNDGTVICWGDNASGQTNMPPQLANVKLLAAGGEQALAQVFSPLTQYQVDVTKDLLLIYNTTSTNSIVVKDYYLAHRPMVSGANVLGINCTTYEIISTTDFTNQIMSSVLNWLAANPAKHPQYLILFPDLPSRTWKATNGQFTVQASSVSFSLHANFPGIKPIVTSINMGLSNLTNDCIAYINKLENFGTNFSPGKLFISASAGLYGNTNYVVDDVFFDENPSNPLTVRNATNGLFSAGVPASAILYTHDYEPCVGGGPIATCTNGFVAKPHLTNAVNVAGYICFGVHSTLGNEYAGTVKWTGNSAWWVIQTIESFNGWRSTGHGNFTQWFAPYAFGSTNDYAFTPVGAVTHADEPGLAANDAAVYFGLWASGKSFASCAWNSRIFPHSQVMQAVGDPFVKK